jgi:5-methylcytosine-specific restriction endonuclease McrA
MPSQKRLADNARRVTAWRQRTKIRAVTYKGGCCQVCGYSRCLRAMVFHHLDPALKDFQIGSGHAKSWDRIRAELDKCVLLCCRCHNEVHDGLITLAPGAGLEPATAELTAPCSAN